MDLFIHIPIEPQPAREFACPPFTTGNVPAGGRAAVGVAAVEEEKGIMTWAVTVCHTARCRFK